MATEEQLYDMSIEELEKEINNIRADEDTSSEATTDEEVEQSTESEVEQEQEEEVEAEPEVDYNDPTADEPTDDGEVAQPQEEATEPKSPRTYKVKANGREFDFTLDELKMLAPKAMDYTKKTQEIAPYRKTINAMRENGVSEEDINMLIDIKRGNKEALASLIKSQNIDLLDLEVDESASNYVPNSYGKSIQEQAMEETIQRLQTKPEVFAQTKAVVSGFDDRSKSIFYENPQYLELLQVDVENGTFDKVLPYAEKLAVLDGNQKSMLEYYMMGGQQYYADLQSKAGNTKQSVKSNTNAKRGAGLPKQSIGGNKKPTNYLEIDDDEYNAWYKEKILNRY